MKTMPRLAILALVSLTLLAGQPLTGERVRIATYNLHNYLSQDRWVGGQWTRNYPKPAEEKAAVRDVILAARPDVLAVQETGGLGYVRELQRDLQTLGLDLPHAYVALAADDERRMGLLSRIEPVAVATHIDIDFPYLGGRQRVKRGLMEATFDGPGEPWTLFIIHLKSRWTDRADDPQSALRREREARALRDFIRKQFPMTQRPRYLIAGDLNDHPASPAVRRFTRIGDARPARVIPAADSRGERWTFHYFREDRYERVDYLMASEALWHRVINRTGHICDVLPQSLTGSDHRLIYADLHLK